MGLFSVDQLAFGCLGFKQTENSIIVHGVQEESVVEHLIEKAISGARVLLKISEQAGQYTVKRVCCTSFIFSRAGA